MEYHSSEGYKQSEILKTSCRFGRMFFCFLLDKKLKMGYGKNVYGRHSDSFPRVLSGVSHEFLLVVRRQRPHGRRAVLGAVFILFPSGDYYMSFGSLPSHLEFFTPSFVGGVRLHTSFVRGNRLGACRGLGASLPIDYFFLNRFFRTWFLAEVRSW